MHRRRLGAPVPIAFRYQPQFDLKVLLTGPVEGSRLRTAIGAGGGFWFITAGRAWVAAANARYPLHDLMTSLKAHKYLALLIVLVGGIIVQSLRHTLLAAPTVLNVLQTVLVVAVFLGVFEQRRTRLAALWFGIVTVMVGWSEYALPPPYYPVASAIEHSLRMVFLGYAAIVILGDIFERRLVRPDDVLGAACGYLLAGVAWANLFQTCEILSPGSFSVGTEIVGQLATPQDRVAVFNYFSLATLTTIGYGDIAPLRGPATVFAALEAVFGQFYIAVVVAQLVGIRLGQAGQRFLDQ